MLYVSWVSLHVERGFRVTKDESHISISYENQHIYIIYITTQTIQNVGIFCVYLVSLEFRILYINKHTHTYTVYILSHKYENYMKWWLESLVIKVKTIDMKV